MGRAWVSASSSICPRGWRLPPNYGARSYDKLLSTSYAQSNEAKSTKMRSIPLDFSFAGNYNYGDGRVYGTGGGGYYWSSTVYSSVYAYNLSFYGGVSPQDINDKAYGLSVRCVVR